MISQTEWEIARQVCTQKQLVALEMWRRGWGARRVARHLQIDVSSARARINSGRKRIYDEQIRRAEKAETLTASDA